MKSNNRRNVQDSVRLHDEDNIPLQQFREVVDSTTRAKEDEMFLLSMTAQKANQII